MAHEYNLSFSRYRYLNATLMEEQVNNEGIHNP